ncbi:MAG: DNA repair protein RadA [Turicibacter sp.]|nr:DNA repair protein RadA [Turicibacter sp.]
MAEKTVYICKSCGYESGKWVGRCMDCGQYNSLEKSVVAAKRQNVANKRDLPLRLAEVSETSEGSRIGTGLVELDKVLNGGVVEGSLLLLGGDPGIGKSTLLLQICSNLDRNGRTCLYVSGEESPRQIKMRADRLGIGAENIYILGETDIDVVISTIEHLRTTKNPPEIVMIDSIQTMVNTELSSAPGSVVQIRECTAKLMRIAKANTATSSAIMVVGHVTKEGAIAGPRLLEHMVDTVLYFEGERTERYRIVRAVKNRFGSTNEIAIFEMQEKGLVEIDNPSAYMLAGRPLNVSGSVITCCLEGSRPILAEIQALCSLSQFGNPRRTATGIDYNRMVMLIAVLEKRAGAKMATYDSYVNVAGGMKIAEPASDAALIAALASSYKNRHIDPHTMIFGEVGLTGELRAVTMAERRIFEAHKLGFKSCILPTSHLKGLKKPEKMEIYGVSNINELLEILL